MGTVCGCVEVRSGNVQSLTGPPRQETFYLNAVTRLPTRTQPTMHPL